MKDNEFKNDPLFAALNKFAGAPSEKSALPTEISEAFNSGRKKARVKKYTIRSAFSALVLAITLPALASANVLPDPVKDFVAKVQHAAITPVKNLIGITDTQNDDDEVTNVAEQQDEFPVDKEAKAEIKAAKEEAKDEAKAAKESAKEIEKEASKSAKEAAKGENVIAKQEAKSAKEVKKEEAQVAKEAAKESSKSTKEVVKDAVKESKDAAKEIAKTEKENKGQSKK